MNLAENVVLGRAGFETQDDLIASVESLCQKGKSDSPTGQDDALPAPLHVLHVMLEELQSTEAWCYGSSLAAEVSKRTDNKSLDVFKAAGGLKKFCGIYSSVLEFVPDRYGGWIQGDMSELEILSAVLAKLFAQGNRCQGATTVSVSAKVVAALMQRHGNRLSPKKFCEQHSNIIEYVHCDKGKGDGFLRWVLANEFKDHNAQLSAKIAAERGKSGSKDSKARCTYLTK